MYSFSAVSCCDPNDAFRSEKTRSAAAEEGWTSKTSLAAADQWGRSASTTRV